jgi:RHS repeat-associated protein
VWGVRYVDELVLRDRDTNGNGTLDERLYALQDANYNVTAITDTAGAVVQRFGYDAYGRAEVLAAGWGAAADGYDWEVRYAGYRWDGESGLYQVRFRYLHPGLGRWVSRDPLGYVDGMSLYQYTGGNPIVFLDPTGLTFAGPGLAAFLDCISKAMDDLHKDIIFANADLARMVADFDLADLTLYQLDLLTAPMDLAIDLASLSVIGGTAFRAGASIPRVMAAARMARMTRTFNAARNLAQAGRVPVELVATIGHNLGRFRGALMMRQFWGGTIGAASAVGLASTLSQGGQHGIERIIGELTNQHLATAAGGLVDAYKKFSALNLPDSLPPILHAKYASDLDKAFRQYEDKAKDCLDLCP